MQRQTPQEQHKSWGASAVLTLSFHARPLTDRVTEDTPQPQRLLRSFPTAVEVSGGGASRSHLL